MSISICICIYIPSVYLYLYFYDIKVKCVSVVIHSLMRSYLLERHVMALCGARLNIFCNKNISLVWHYSVPIRARVSNKYRVESDLR